MFLKIILTQSLHLAVQQIIAYIRLTVRVCCVSYDQSIRLPAGSGRKRRWRRRRTGHHAAGWAGGDLPHRDWNHHAYHRSPWSRRSVLRPPYNSHSGHCPSAVTRLLKPTRTEALGERKSPPRQPLICSIWGSLLCIFGLLPNPRRGAFRVDNTAMVKFLIKVSGSGSRSGIPPKSDRLFHRPCASFPPNFV